jgi:hypothetical protein
MVSSLVAAVEAGLGPDPLLRLAWFPMLSHPEAVPAAADLSEQLLKNLLAGQMTR